MGRTESPGVWQTCAWWNSRSTVAVARILDQGVEPVRVKLGGDRDGAFLVSGVDEPVEVFGGVSSDFQQPDVIDQDQVGAEDPDDDSIDGAVGAVGADQSAEVLEAEPGGTRIPASTTCWSRASRKTFPGPEEPANDDVVSDG